MLGYLRQVDFKNCPVLLELFAEDHPNTTIKEFKKRRF